MKKTILCLLLALGLLLLSAAAMAASDPDNYFFDMMEGNITIEDADTSEMVKVTYGNPQTTTAEFDPQEHVITVGGSISPNPLQLSINTTVPVKIIYQVYIGRNSNTNTISIADNADVTLSLTGSANDVSGTLTQPGIELGSGSKLTIQATADNNILRVYGISKAILGPDDDEPPATVILNSGTVAIIRDSGSGISGNVNLVINGGQFVANGTTINVNSLIVTGGELCAGSDSSTKVTYDGLKNNPDSYSNLHCAASILPHSVENYGELIVFDELTLPVDLTIPDEKKLILDSYHDSSLTIPDDRSLTCNGTIYIYTDSTLTNNGTLTFENFSLLTGKMTNTGTLIINYSSLKMDEGSEFGTLNNTGTISGTGYINPPLTQNQPKFLTIESIENGTVTLAEVEAGITDAEYSKDGTSWQKSPVFERVDLSAGQTFYARYKADGHFYQESDKTSITVYPFSLNANGGTIASGKDVGYYIAGQSTPLPTDVKKENYSFAGWYDNEALTGNPMLAIGANDTGLKTLWAKWKPDTYTVTLNTNGGTINSGNLTGYTYGEGATLPTDVTRQHYSFVGWYDNEALTGDITFAIGAYATGIKEYWAKWKPDTYTVTLNTNGGWINSGNLTGYTYGVGATLPTDVTRQHYTFEGWFNNEALTGDPVTDIAKDADEPKTFWAKWKPDSYTVTLDANGGTINSGNLTGYTHGVGATLPTDVTREHYTFAGWYDNATGDGTPFTEISGDATSPKVFWAKWIPDTYNLTLKANGGTILSGNLTSYTYGEVTPLPTNITRPGYTFAGWFDDETFSGNSYICFDTTETGDKTLWAYWLPSDFTVTLNVNGGTINSGNLTGYIFGMGAMLPTDVTRAGYTFAGWYDNEALTGSPVTEIAKDATGDKTYWAKWRVIITAPAGAIVSGEAFAKLPVVKAPTLVLPDGKTLDASITLRYEKLSTSKENTVVYDIYLVDQDGNRVKLPYACTLCIPYPDGLNQNSQSAYHINILHEMDGGKSEDFDSVNSGLELKQQGLCVQVSSLSPFTITWERLPEADLPQTGDSSHPGLWLALMLASAIALAILLRGRKTA